MKPTKLFADDDDGDVVSDSGLSCFTLFLLRALDLECSICDVCAAPCSECMDPVAGTVLLLLLPPTCVRRLLAPLIMDARYGSGGRFALACAPAPETLERL